LDVGCGYGMPARALNTQYGYRVLGIDQSPEMIAAERFLEKNERIRLMVEMVKIFHRFSLRVNSITSFSTPQYLFSPTRR
jgi:SAM-dependent methyltransferase